MTANHFDYIIVGNGLAGLQLALALSQDAFFKSKQIALIDKSKKNTNDKTWCFWEKNSGKWDDIVSNTWTKGIFHSDKNSLSLNLDPYLYKKIRSIDFYEYAIRKIEQNKNFTFIYDEIKEVQEENLLSVKGKIQNYFCNHIFDSRLPSSFFEENDKFTRIYQHFKGWTIETDSDVFDPDKFVMMDYRIKHLNDTTFTYILPFSKRKALVEFTFFTPYVVKSDLYNDYLKDYISSILKIDNYKIVDEEVGNIPMTNYPFDQDNSKSVTKIGTGGGWVKGSTGYSFKHTEKKISKIISNLKNNRIPSTGLFKQKFRFYDTVFLNVLKNENDKGEWIFDRFYSKNSIQQMFKFLDEETSLPEEIRLISPLFSWTFLKSFFKTL